MKKFLLVLLVAFLAFVGKAWADEPWEQLEGIPSDAEVRDIEVDPSDSGTIYFATGSGVLKSSDAGQSSTKVLDDPTNALTSNSAGEIAAGTSSEGVKESADDGTTWDQIPGTAGGNFADVAATDGEVVGAAQGGVSTGVYVDGTQVLSTTSGASAVAVGSSNTLFGADLAGNIFKSTDGGSSWVSLGSLGFAVNAITIDPNDPNTVYFATDQGMYKSTDGGATLNPFNSGLPSGTYIIAAAFDPSGNLYCGGEEQVYRLGSGDEWGQLGNLPYEIQAIAASMGSSSTIIFAGTTTNGALKYIIEVPAPPSPPPSPPAEEGVEAPQPEPVTVQRVVVIVWPKPKPEPPPPTGTILVHCADDDPSHFFVLDKDGIIRHPSWGEKGAIKWDGLKPGKYGIFYRGQLIPSGIVKIKVDESAERWCK